MNKNSTELRNAFGYLLVNELEALRRIASALPRNSTCVNIGAGVGTSGLVFMESPRVGKLYTIDIQDSASPFGGLENERIAFREAGYANDPRHHQIHGDSAQAGMRWSKEKVNLVFIDGDHSYEHCRDDMLAWLPNIVNNGILVFHDYSISPWEGVWRCINQYLLHDEPVEDALPRYPVVEHADSLIAFRITRSARKG